MSRLPQVDVVLLTRNADSFHPAVDQGLRAQSSVDLVVHRIVGAARSGDQSRYETIARARNEGRLSGDAPWLMFLDDDVVLEPNCVAVLIQEMNRRPAFGALAADYLGEHVVGRIPPHVSMGATLFRREALRRVTFRWEEDRCECQCCCDDLRRSRWGIDYCPAARAHHLPKPDADGGLPARQAPMAACCGGRCSRQRGAPTICLVVCYLGPLPGWINYYLQTCAFNPTIDFLIFTDQPGFPAAPPNVRFENITATQFERLASAKLGFPIKLSHPRKLCDFKPAYGRLFEEHLSRYAYWGYTDLDLIYGNLRHYLGEARLQTFDVFTARREFLVGHFTLLRNVPEMTMLYQQSGDLQALLQSTSVLSFDECGQQWWQRMEGKPLTSDAACDSMTHIVHRLAERGALSAGFFPAVLEWPELPGHGWRLQWKSGRLSLAGEDREPMYVHFHGFKDNLGFCQPPPYREGPFEMTPDGFEPAATSFASSGFAAAAVMHRNSRDLYETPNRLVASSV